MDYVLRDTFPSVSSRYLRIMGGSSALMALVAGAGVLFGNFWIKPSWPITSATLVVAGICFFAANNEQDEDAWNTFWAIVGFAALSGIVVGQLALLSGVPLIFSMAVWAALLVAAMSVFGALWPQVFTEKGGLTVLFGGTLFLFFLFEQVAFLYFGSTETESYHMTPLAWIGVAAFGALTAVCWRFALAWLLSDDDAIRAAGGPLVNAAACVRALFQVLDRMSVRAPGTHWDDDD